MKIKLSAFGGKLNSQIMEWPERVGSRVYLILDIDTLKPSRMDDGSLVTSNSPRMIKATFQWTGKVIKEKEYYQDTERRGTQGSFFVWDYRLVDCLEYVLVDIS